MLEINNIQVSHGRVQALFGVSLTAHPGEILCLLGRNGAGKTTTLKSIMGLLPLTSGTITFEGQDIGSIAPHEIPARRIGYIPQGRRLFSELTVAENIEMGMMVCKSGQDVRERVLEIFPRLRERLNQRASTLSGGEQQMLATARALCLRPKLLLLDEPTEGLQPSIIEQIRQVIVQMRDEGVAVILVEQRVDAVLSIADKVVFIEHGQDVETLTAKKLQKDQSKIHRYLGV